MPVVELVGRDGDTTPLPATAGESLQDVLIRASVPPESVIPHSDGEPVSEFRQIEPGHRYELVLIEGYDLDSITHLYDDRVASPEVVHTKQRIRIDADGDVSGSRDDLDSTGLTDYVERVLLETLTHYDLVDTGDSVVLGLSGELDSSSLAVALEAIRPELPPLDLAAVTVNDVTSLDGSSSAVDHALELAEDLGVEHHVIGRDRVRDLYDLNLPVADAFSVLERQYPDHTWAIHDQLLTRLLEDFATTNGFDRVCLGTHANDMVASFLDASVSGLEMGSFPRHEAGRFTYIYPAVLLSKRELYLYYVLERGDFVEPVVANRWEHQPAEQSFLYYLADVVRSHWPGIEHWLVERGHGGDGRSEDEYVECVNCAKSERKRSSRSDSSEHCTLCSMLDAHGLIDGD